ncbi:hypothetical protein OROMI_025416 [Orobanche minor]
MNTISEITPTKETWKLHVRVERLWTTYSPYNPTEKRSMELILLDAKGDKIQASIPKYLISKFEKLIKEGVFYHFTNFEIEQNNEEFIATRHPYRLKFHKFTSPRPAENLPIPKYGFKFIPFAEFGTDKCYAKLLVDVIAEVLNVGDIFELNKNGQCTKRVTIHLLDSIPNGVKYLQNSIFATRMLINEDVPELADFMNSIKENSDARHLISKQSLSHGSDALSDDFSTLLQFKSICELDSTTEECCCLTIAKILNIHKNYIWFYDACNKCFKKVSVLDKSYWYEKCKMRPTSVLTSKYIYQLFIDGSKLLKQSDFSTGTPMQKQSYTSSNVCFMINHSVFVDNIQDNFLAMHARKVWKILMTDRQQIHTDALLNKQTHLPLSDLTNVYH